MIERDEFEVLLTLAVKQLNEDVRRRSWQLTTGNWQLFFWEKR